MTDTETAAALLLIGNQVTALLTQATSTNTAQASQTALFGATKDRVDELPLVENTADVDKVISNAVIAALLQKQDALVSSANIVTINGQSLLQAGDLAIIIGATLTVTMDYDDRHTLRVIAATAGDSISLDLIGKLVWQPENELLDDDETCFVTTVNGVVTGQWVMREPSYNFTELYRLADQDLRDKQLREAGITT